MEPKRGSPVTRADVARAAGVSGPSVSVALNGSRTGRVSEETRQRILRVVEELGYVPNNAARTISGRKSHNIGVLAPWTASTWYFAHMLDGVGSAAAERHYGVVLCEPLPAKGTPRGCIRFFRERRFDGVVYMPPDTAVMPVLSALRAAGIPTVICNGADPGGELDYAVMDYAFGMATAAKELYGKGVREFLYIFPMDPEVLCSGDRERFSGFRQGIPFPDAHLTTAVMEEQTSAEKCIRHGEELLSRFSGPVGVAASVQRNACFLLQAALRMGKRPGIDIYLVSGDDPVDFLPDIRSIHLPFFDVGKTAASRLIEQLEGNGRLSRGIRIPEKPIF